MRVRCDESCWNQRAVWFLGRYTGITCDDAQLRGWPSSSAWAITHASCSYQTLPLNCNLQYCCYLGNPAVGEGLGLSQGISIGLSVAIVPSSKFLLRLHLWTSEVPSWTNRGAPVK